MCVFVCVCTLKIFPFHWLSLETLKKKLFMHVCDQFFFFYFSIFVPLSLMGKLWNQVGKSNFILIYGDILECIDLNFYANIRISLSVSTERKSCHFVWVYFKSRNQTEENVQCNIFESSNSWSSYISLFLGLFVCFFDFPKQSLVLFSKYLTKLITNYFTLAALENSVFFQFLFLGSYFIVL